jgi:hypothetical protein
MGTNTSAKHSAPSSMYRVRDEKARSTYQNVRRYIIEVRSFETRKLYAADTECGNKFSAFDRNLLDLAAEQCWLVRL